MLVTSDDLRPLGAAATPYAPDTPRPGWAEQAPELWDGALGITIGKALGAATGGLRRRAGVTRDAVRRAREKRNRYTFLDLAADSGWLDDADIL